MVLDFDAFFFFLIESDSRKNFICITSLQFDSHLNTLFRPLGVGISRNPLLVLLHTPNEHTCQVSALYDQ